MNLRDRIEKALEPWDVSQAEIDAIIGAIADCNAEPFGFFRVVDFDHWENCAETDEGAKALYEVTFDDAIQALKWFSRMEKAESLVLELAAENAAMKEDLKTIADARLFLRNRSRMVARIAALEHGIKLAREGMSCCNFNSAGERLAHLCEQMNPEGDPT